MSFTSEDAPSSLEDLDHDWLASICRQRLFDDDDAHPGRRELSMEIQKDPEGCSEGALSDILRVVVNVQRLDSEMKEPPRQHFLFIKIIPESMKSLILRHGLFERETIMYRDVFPLMMQRVIIDRLPDFAFKHFRLPKYIYGCVKEGKGILILEDLTASGGYKIGDSPLKLLDITELEIACSALAEFHAFSMAFEATSSDSLVEMFPILDAKRLIWFQEDMLPFIETMNVISKIFLRNIPNERQTSRRFEIAVRHPMSIFLREIGRRSPFSCLQHGDSWHNNFLFKSGSSTSGVIDWQLSYVGNGLSDLSYLLYSSSSRLNRLERPCLLIHAYLNVLTSTLNDLGFPKLADGMRENIFISEFKKSLPMTLLLCGNIEDLTLREFNEEDAKSEDLSRKVSVASDMDMISLHQDTVPRGITPRKGRSLRRKHYVDICNDILYN